MVAETFISCKLPCVGINTKLNAKLALRQRADLFEANISNIENISLKSISSLPYCQLCIEFCYNSHSTSQVRDPTRKNQSVSFTLWVDLCIQRFLVPCVFYYMEGELKLCRRIKKKNQLISYRVSSIDFFFLLLPKKYRSWLHRHTNTVILQDSYSGIITGAALPVLGAVYFNFWVILKGEYSNKSYWQEPIPLALQGG